MSVAIDVMATSDIAQVAAMVGELLAEISDAVARPVFRFDLADTVMRLNAFIEQGHYHVFVARLNDQAVGFLALYESHALYAEGAFGTIAELYVRPAWRSAQVGTGLLAAARALGREKGWTRLEVTTPPIPPFERTEAFYRREGFEVSGGRKLRVLL